jgi:hypothetical protein
MCVGMRNAECGQTTSGSHKRHLWSRWRYVFPEGLCPHPAFRIPYCSRGANESTLYSRSVSLISSRLSVLRSVG